METIHLLGIAPYNELQNSMMEVAQEFNNIHLDVYTANLDEGQQLAIDMASKGYDGIISRGGTAHLIQQVVDIPVIDISISIYDILSSIKLAQNYSQNIAIVGYDSITKNAHLICNVLQYPIKIFTIENATDPKDILLQLKDEGYDLMLCDAITNQVALSLSINTILITSGMESIQTAYHQAVSQVSHLQIVKKKNQLLEATMQQQSLEVIVFDKLLTPLFSNITTELAHSITRFLKRKEQIETPAKYYHNFRKQTYQLAIQELGESSEFFHCEVKLVTPPIIHQQAGLSYNNRESIRDHITKKLMFTSFIQKKNLNLLPQLLKHYNAMMIFGEEGTIKTSLAYTSFLHFRDHTENLVTINCKLLGDKLWKYLTNSTTSPLLDTDNTLLFQHCEQLSLKDAQKIIHIINDSSLLQRQNVIFTYTTHKSDPQKLIFQEIMNNLNCASLYSASLTERHAELSNIITLLLNKVNIECHTQVIGFEPTAFKTLQEFKWTSHFYQLERVLKKLVLSSTSPYIAEHQVSEVLAEERKHENHLQAVIYEQNPAILPKIIEEKTLFDYNQDLVQMVLEANNGNQTKTAKQLGISRTTLWRYLKID
ncbi:PrpR N-terminal domain-containing protein [Streptococcus cameli]